LFCALAPAVAAAHDGPPPIKIRRPGTTFIAEVNVGATLSGDLAVGGLLGVGGKLKSFPPRFYLVGEFIHSTANQSGVLPGLPLSYAERLRYEDMALGLRVYFPIIRRVRLLLDVMGGASQVTGSLRRESLAPLDLDCWRPLGLLATGVQVRWFYHLSIGVRARVVYTDDGTAALRELRGGGENVRASVTGGLTWHF
jgi:hypothetical protein